MMPIVQKGLAYLNKSFGIYDVKGIYVEPRYWMALAIVLVVFMGILTMARLRYLYIHWSLGRPALSMIFWGFILALVVEGFFMIFGKTMFTEVLGWKSAPKPISTLLDISRNKLINVLGAEDEKATLDSVIKDLNGLSKQEKEKVLDSICE